MFIKGTLFYCFIIAIFSILFIYSKSYLILAFSILIILFVSIRINKKLSLFMVAIFVFFSFYKVNTFFELSENYIEDSFVVNEAKENYIIVSNNDINYLVYVDEGYNRKDKVYIQGDILLIEKDLDIDVFEFKDYLNNKRVFYKINPHYIETISTNNALNDTIIKKLTSYLKNESYSMTMMLLFNDKNIDKQSYDNLKQINAVHLFVVSGFHVSFLYSFICKLFKNKKIGLLIANIISFIYIYLLNFSISAFRAFISTFLYKLFPSKLNKTDCISISGLILLLIEPLNIYNYSFIMSFLITFAISFVSILLKKKSKLFQTIVISLFAFLVMIPIQLILNYEINVLSMISNIFLSYVVMVLFFLCIIGVLISPLNGNVFSYIYSLFNKAIDYLSTLNTSIVFGSLKPWMIVVYYFLIIISLLLLERKKIKISAFSLSLVFVFLIALYFKSFLCPFQKVTFLNVNQGDCIIIQDSFSDKVMLIDTGGNINYDIASKKIMPYLSYQGIRKIDIVVISHDDYDHNGALTQLINMITIKSIISNNAIDFVDLGKIHLENINHFYSQSSDKNDSSIVLYGNIGGSNFLFTGDISSKIEEKIILNYPSLNVDILKVAHHGSKYSTSDEFVKAIKPSYGIISVGKYNLYDHPSDSVLQTLNENNVVVYTTDNHGTIRFVFKNDELLFIETAK